MHWVEIITKYPERFRGLEFVPPPWEGAWACTDCGAEWNLVAVSTKWRHIEDAGIEYVLTDDKKNGPVIFEMDCPFCKTKASKIVARHVFEAFWEAAKGWPARWDNYTDQMAEREGVKIEAQVAPGAGEKAGEGL